MHTKGKWEITFPAQIWSEGVLVAEHIENPADRTLISAAPELLEACEGLVTWINLTAMYHLRNAGFDEEVLPKGWDKWQAAIRKARGL